MEQFGEPLREIEKKWKKSELGIMAWRSQEQAYKMHQQFNKSAPKRKWNEVDDEDTINAGRRRQTDGSAPQGLPAHFYNKEGEIDLRQVTGPEAYKYFQALGIPLMVVD